MNTEELKNFIRKIRPEADQSQQPSMVPFADGNNRLECPWLRWFCRDNRNHIYLRGILLMQDWGTVQSDYQKIDDAADDIGDFLKQSPKTIKDKTIRNLLLKDKWAAALNNRSILLSNAVWGLRGGTDESKKISKCGYLGATIHKNAFLTWGRLVAKLAAEAAELKDDFRLFVAGEWARFEHQENKSGEKLSDYLKRWRDWVTAKNVGSVALSDLPERLRNDKEIERCIGSVIFLRHPCIWDLPDNFENCPLAKITHKK